MNKEEIIEGNKFNPCPEFPFFGAKYPDARCVDGQLYDLDKCDDHGNLYEMGEYWPCPFCKTKEFIQTYHEYSDLPKKQIREMVKTLMEKEGYNTTQTPKPEQVGSDAIEFGKFIGEQELTKHQVNDRWYDKGGNYIGNTANVYQLFAGAKWAEQAKQEAPGDDGQSTHVKREGVLKLVRDGEPITLGELSPGSLFYFQGCFALKSEYRVPENGAIEAHIVGSGEMFWGGTNTADAQRLLIVYPITIKNLT